WGAGRGGGDVVRVRAAREGVALPPLAVLSGGGGPLRGGYVPGYMAGPPRLGLLEHSDRRDNLAGRAVAALERVMLDERPLHRVQLAPCCEPLGRDDLRPVMRDGQRPTADAAPAAQP